MRLQHLHMFYYRNSISKPFSPFIIIFFRTKCNHSTAFEIVVPSIWNAIPIYIRISLSLNSEFRISVSSERSPSLNGFSILNPSQCHCLLVHMLIRDRYELGLCFFWKNPWMACFEYVLYIDKAQQNTVV